MIDHSELTTQFASLFSGRTDAYGSWEGGCIKENVTISRFMRHLWGQEYIGIYPMLDDSTVWWGCSDIDVDDIDQARNIQLALHLKGVTSWVERTVKGFHVWVFASEPIDAKIMRRALLAVHAVAKVPPKEINPKQEETVGYGNYVRLPYPGALLEVNQSRYMLDNGDNPMSLESFISEAILHRVATSDIAPLAQCYVPKKSITFNSKVDPLAVDVVRTMLPPLPLKIFMDGPMQHQDRSTTLVNLAHQLRKNDFSAELCYSIVRMADLRWGKFHTREDGELHLTKIVENVYAE